MKSAARASRSPEFDSGLVTRISSIGSTIPPAEEVESVAVGDSPGTVRILRICQPVNHFGARVFGDGDRDDSIA